MDPMTNRVHIFDTTLRDGEQSPGCSMTVAEKLRMAKKLVELGVDTLEAGFPIASEGDYDAVRAIGQEYPEVQVAALARSCSLDVERAAILGNGVGQESHDGRTVDDHAERDQPLSEQQLPEPGGILRSHGLRRLLPGGSGR